MLQPGSEIRSFFFFKLLNNSIEFHCMAGPHLIDPFKLLIYVWVFLPSRYCE